MKQLPIERSVSSASSVSFRLAVAALLTFAPFARADDAPSDVFARLAPNAEIDKIFSRWDKSDSPGVALSVVRDGSIIYHRGYGQANLDYPVPITPDSVFYMASVSKQFTAACIALLAIDGKLDLDDDIHHHLPELPDYGHTITTRHLVHHTSGLPDYLTLMVLTGQPFGNEYTRDEILEFISQNDTLNFDPGDEYLYSNTGYFLLAVMVERASGKSMREFADERIFKPLEMNSTNFHDDHRQIVKNRVISYGKPLGSKDYQISYLANFDQVGSGGLLSTARDMARWDANFDSLKIGGSDWKQLMLTRGVLNDGETLSYAFGLGHGGYKGLSTIGHGGSMMGFRTHYLRFPEQRVAVNVLANLGSIDPSALAKKVADVVLADEISANLRSYVGTYRHHRLDISYEVSVEDGELMLTGGGTPKPSKLASRDNLDEFKATLGATIVFHRDDAGAVVGCTVDAGRARNIRLTRAE